jgi:DNA primase
MLRTVVHENTLGAEVKVVVLPEGQDPDDVIKGDPGEWDKLVEKAVPLLDFLFRKTTENLDLTRAGDKSKAAEKLVPVLRNLNDTVRQAHYFQLLAKLLNVDVATLMALRGPRPAAARRAPAPASAAFSKKVAGTSALEDYLLALLVANPHLRTHPEQPEPVYFTRSDNRAIYEALRRVTAASAETPAVLKDTLDPVLHEHVDEIAARVLPITKNAAEMKYVDCLYRLKDNYFKTLAARQGAAEGEDTDTLLHDAVTISAGRREVDTHRKSNRNNSRR